MFNDPLQIAQKAILKGINIKGYKDFQCCQKSWISPPQLVIFENGFKYIDGLTTCKHFHYCAYCHKVKLHEQGHFIKLAEKYIQQENLSVTLVTLTLPRRNNDLRKQRLILDSATRNLIAESKNKVVKGINKSVGSEGYILRNEVSFSTTNGLNPHCHILTLNRDSYSAVQKDLIIDSYIAQLEDSGLFFNRLDKLKIQVNFTDNFKNIGYLAKPSTEIMELAVTEPNYYIQLAQSCNVETKIPLVKFKNGLKTKIIKALNLSGNEDARQIKEIKRIKIPEYLLNENLSVEEIFQKMA